MSKTVDIYELVKRLRSEEWATVEREQTRNAAADALEAMAGERDKTRADYEAMKAHNKELFGKLSAAELGRDRLKAALSAIAVKAGTSECGGNYVAAVSLIGDLEQMADAALRAAAGSALEAKT